MWSSWEILIYLTLIGTKYPRARVCELAFIIDVKQVNESMINPYLRVTVLQIGRLAKDFFDFIPYMLYWLANLYVITSVIMFFYDFRQGFATNTW